MKIVKDLGTFYIFRKNTLMQDNSSVLDYFARGPFITRNEKYNIMINYGPQVMNNVQ